jgi:hypothetical protein
MLETQLPLPDIAKFSDVQGYDIIISSSFELGRRPDPTVVSSSISARRTLGQIKNRIAAVAKAGMSGHGSDLLNLSLKGKSS